MAALKVGPKLLRRVNASELGETAAAIADTDGTYQYRLTHLGLTYTIAAPK